MLFYDFICFFGGWGSQWARAHGPNGQGPMGPMGQGPWARAHGPGPTGPGRARGPETRGRFFHQNCSLKKVTFFLTNLSKQKDARRKYKYFRGGFAPRSLFWDLMVKKTLTTKHKLLGGRWRRRRRNNFSRPSRPHPQRTQGQHIP